MDVRATVDSEAVAFVNAVSQLTPEERQIQLVLHKWFWEGKLSASKYEDMLDVLRGLSQSTAE